MQRSSFTNNGMGVLAVLVAALSSAALADVPRLIHYQGKLVSAAGAIVAGPVDLRARLYASATPGGPVLFDETHSAVPLTRGLFSVLLGSQTGGGVPDSVLTETSVYLGVAVDGAAELAPRIRIAAAPYAGKARSAEQLVGPDTVTPAVTVDGAGDVHVQRRLGIGMDTPVAPTAAVEISSTTGGLLIPRMTAAQRDALVNPALGLQIFNIDSNCLNMWVGSTWKQACYDCAFSPPVAANNGPICEGDTLNLTATAVSGATYSWTGPNGFSSADQNPSILNATSAASGPYSVTAAKDGCTSNPLTTVASVNAVPTPPTAGNDGPICAGQNLQLTASLVAGGSYDWTGPNGFTSNDQNPSIANATTSAGGTYTVDVTVNGCTSPAVTTDVVVNQAPAAPGPISGSTSVCRDSTSIYSISDVPGATVYTWSAPPEATVTAGQGTAFATVTFGAQPGNVSVTAGNSCGTSEASTLAINVMGSSSSQTFNYSGDVQTFVVPACVSTLTLDVWGGQGGAGSHSGVREGGRGGYATGTRSVSPGQTLYVYVGGRGTDFGGPGGWNGGGTGGSYGSGGGATDVRTVGGPWNDSAGLNARVIVAGGGGGTTGQPCPGGGGGGTNGENGIIGSGCSGNPNNGGTQSSGGGGDSPGGFGYGGNFTVSNYSGGGSGWYGGGAAHGAGGGSGYIGGVSGGSMQTGVQQGNGTATISW